MTRLATPELAPRPSAPGRARTRRLRLLPVVVVAAAVVLTLRVGLFWHDLAAPAHAAEDTLAEPAPAQNTAAERAPAPSNAAPGKTAAPDPAPDPHALVDLSTLTEAEIAVLQKLAARRDTIEKWEADLALREKMLQGAEARIEQKIGELNEIKATVEALMGAYDAEQENKLKSLVTIYEKMKPKDAAAILEGLDIGVQLDVVRRMKETKVAPIIAAMAPAKAGALTAELAARAEPGDLAETRPR